MTHGRQGSGAELSSSDEEDGRRGDRPEAPQRPAAAGALLERCAPASPASRDSSAAESEGVFEIRDFTTASSFERIAHQITVAAKKWAGILKASTPDDGGQLLREDFDHMDFKYDLLFQLAQRDNAAQPAAKGGAGDRLGMHTFPSRAHRLTKWFGVHHFVIVSVRGQNIDLDSARTVLSALVLAVQSVAASLPQPLSCFVPVDGGRRRRYLGELPSGGWRTLYTTEMATSVQPDLEHLEGLSEFFWQKLRCGPQDPPQTLVAGVRFTYLADAFDPMTWADEAVPPAGAADAAAAAGGAPAQGATLDRDETDPVDTMQLHCLWPSFPQGSFVDSAVFSELEPRSAPFWKLRVMKTDGAPLPLSKLLRTLLEFRKEAGTVRSAEHSVQPQMPKTALASLSYAIQESLESILLPTPGEMHEQVEACLAYPVVVAAAGPGPPCGTQEVAALRGAARGTRLAKFAELAARMRCFKGCVTLWCQILAHMRKQWEALDPPLPNEAAPGTHRVGARGIRTEFFDPSVCLAQQKLEMLRLSAEVLRGGRLVATAVPVPDDLRLEASGAPLTAPRLLRPALMTDDMVVQQDMAAASIAEPAERAELHLREVQADASAFKAANPDAELADFLRWRSEVEHLSLEPFPAEWLSRVWEQAPAQPGEEQAARLFEPEREAEMALHFLENIDGTQLLLQTFRVRLRTSLEELSSSLEGSESAHLRVLRDRAVCACVSAFGAAGREGLETPVGEEVDAAAGAAIGETDEFPSEASLQAALAATEALEAGVRLVASLRAKLPGTGGALFEELLAEGEATVSSNDQRQAVEALFERARVLAQCQGREPLDGKGVFESLPLSKEFILQLQPSEAGPAEAAQPCPRRRLYAEVRERHLRLAISRSFRMA